MYLGELIISHEVKERENFRHQVGKSDL